MFKVVIVGRANVGKSLLFNKICKERRAIVSEEEGVTRDRISSQVVFTNKQFEIVDSPGFEFEKKGKLNQDMNKQAQLAIEYANVIIMVVDGKIGPTLIDKKVSEILLKSNKKIILAINKIDRQSFDFPIHDFYTLAIDTMIPISALTSFQVDLLLKTALLDSLENDAQEKAGGIKIALLGRTNVGKSSLFNSLIQDDRSIVNEMPATTRDAIDSEIIYNGKSYIFIDTAGIRRKHKEKDVLEKFASLRTEEAIKRADICALVLDAESGLHVQEKRMLSMIADEKKPCLVLFNKWDLLQNMRMERYLQAFKEIYPDLICLCVSAKTKRNMDKIFFEVDRLEVERKRKISTPILNKFFQKTIFKCSPPAIKGKRLKLYYLTQTGQNPARFVLFVNQPTLLTQTYQKYLINELRKQFGFVGVPIIFDVKGKQKQPEAV